MSVEDYIASGILEAYLLGELTPEERNEVETMAAKYPAIRQEMLAIEETLERMAQTTAIQPPTKSKNRILHTITTEQTPESLTSKESASRAYKIWPIMAAASLVIALVATVAALNFHGKWKDAESRLSDLITQNQQLAEQYNTASHQLERTNEYLAITTSDQYKKVVLSAVQPTGAIAVVYWNQDSEEVYLNAANLPQPPADKQYQLWALLDGQPIDAGIFEFTDTTESLLEMKSMAAADAFAITLEPVGGSVSPTLDDLQVIGNV